jgi:hypothetical protein
MITWDEAEAVVARAVRHFAAVRTVEMADAYAREMALRHIIECGSREVGEALSALGRLHRKGAGFSLLSHDLRKAYLALRALEYEEMASPSDIDNLILQEAMAAAAVFAEDLQEDFRRIRKENENA